MKVLVTGGTGFIGSTLVRHLLEAHYDVRVLARRKKNRFLLEGLGVEIVEGDTTDPNAVEKAVKGCSVVFDVASVYAFYPFWEKKARALYKINVQGTMNMLNASLSNGVERFIHTSTIATIGKRPDGKPSNEETGFDPKNASHYARSKYLAEQEVLKFCRKGLSTVILNPAIVIGERDYKPTPSGDVIVKFLNRSYPGYFDTLWAVADADDVAKAHIAAIKRGRVGERYILCNKRHYSLKEIFQILEQISGIKAPRLKIPYPLLLGFVYLDETLSYFLFQKKPLMPTEGVGFCKMSTRYDNSKAVNELGYTSTPMQETLAKAVLWYRKNAYIEPRGILRIKTRGSKKIESIMRRLKMNKLTDKLSIGTFGFFLMVKFLQLLQKVGFIPKEDGWRRVTQSYLRTEHSKFSLAVFGLNFWSGLGTKDDKTLVSARQHLIERLVEFLRQCPSTHYRLQWRRFSAKQETKKSVDIVWADFDKNGKLKNIEPHLDLSEDNEKVNDILPELRTALIQGFIKTYNKTRNYDDKKRPLILRKELNEWRLRQSRLIPNRIEDQAGHFVERILSAAFIHFEELPLAVSTKDNRRFCVPSFIKYKHPGFGLLNIVCRFTADFNEVDLWIQFSHIPIDGVPAQEVLNNIRRNWGKSNDLKFPSPDYQEGIVPDLCSTKEAKNGVCHVYQFVDFQPFLRFRKELNKRYAKQANETVTSAALLIWKLAQYKEFEDIKFAVPIDLRATDCQERTLGFVFIRPNTYFDRDKPDRGFFKFQQEFNRQLRATRKRNSEGYRLLESFALASPMMYAATSKLMSGALKEFVGTVGVTIIKKADFFISPYSDIHTGGFIAFSNFSLPSKNGGKVGVVSIKGPKEKIQKYMRIINDIINRTIKHDELYF